MPTFYFYNCIAFHFNMTFKCLYVHVFLYKKFNINFTLYLIYMGPYYTICIHFMLTTRGYIFYSNIIYMCLHVFLFKKNLTSITCCIYFIWRPYYIICLHFTLITIPTYASHFNITYKCLMLYLPVFLFKIIKF